MKVVKLSNKVSRHISIAYETEQIIRSLFSEGQFSNFVESKIREEVATRLKLNKNPEIKKGIANQVEIAVQGIIRNWNNPTRKMLIAQHQERIIKEMGGLTSASELISNAEKRVK